MYMSINIWINVGGFFAGLLVGGLILLGILKQARNNMNDLWDDEEEEEEEE